MITDIRPYSVSGLCCSITCSAVHSGYLEKKVTARATAKGSKRNGTSSVEKVGGR